MLVAAALCAPADAGAANMQMISLSNAVIDFGTQILNEPALVQMLVISNVGSDPLFVSDVSLSSVNANDLASFEILDAPVGGFTLGPQEKVALKLQFTPSRDGNYSARLTIQSDDRNNGVAAVTLVGRGLATPVTIEPGTIDFGIFRAGTDPGSTNSRTITITNNSPSPVTLLDPVIGGMRPNDFTCTAVRTLDARRSATAIVTYKATDVAFAEAQVQFPVVGIGLKPALLAVSGQTVKTLFTLTPSGATAPTGTLDFGRNLFLGSPSALRSVTVTNNTVQPLQVASISIDDARFGVNGGGAIGRPIPAGGTADFTVSYLPARLGLAQGRLTMTVLGFDGDDATMDLVATVVPPPLEGGGAACALGQDRTAGTPAIVALLLAPLALLRRRRARR